MTEFDTYQGASTISRKTLLEVALMFVNTELRSSCAMWDPLTGILGTTASQIFVFSGFWVT
jgi:hypothetical protein